MLRVPDAVALPIPCSSHSRDTLPRCCSLRKTTPKIVMNKNSRINKNHHPSQSLKVQNFCHDQVKNVIHVAPAGDKGMRRRSFG